jgi:Peptidase U49
MTQQVFLQILFQQFEPAIRNVYERAAREAGLDSQTVPLELTATSWRFGRHEAEFAALADPLRVAITWNGIASLWAISHAVARVGRVMFEAQRKLRREDDRRLMLTDYPDAETGLLLFILSRNLAKQHFEQWIVGGWAPAPTAQPNSEDDLNGNAIFLRALDWIIRHELGHLVRKHLDENGRLREDHFRREGEADETATRWMKGARAPDPVRPAGAQPAAGELFLENAAVGIFTGLVWISQFECVPHAESHTHPAASDRLMKVLDILDLREDSGALEIVSYAIKALIDPQGRWPDGSDKPTALDAAQEAAIQLSRFIQSNR